MTEKKMLKCGDIRISFGTIQSAFKSWIQSKNFESCTSQMKLFIQFGKPCLYLFSDNHIYLGTPGPFLFWDTLSTVILEHPVCLYLGHPARIYFGTPCLPLFGTPCPYSFWDTLSVFLLVHSVHIYFGTPCPYLFKACWSRPSVQFQEQPEVAIFCAYRDGILGESFRGIEVHFSLYHVI